MDSRQWRRTLRGWLGGCTRCGMVGRRWSKRWILQFHTTYSRWNSEVLRLAEIMLGWALAILSVDRSLFVFRSDRLTLPFVRQMAAKLKSRSALELLQQFESRNVTFIDSDGSWPVVWERARGVHVWDVEGKRYLDLSAAFGV